MKKLKILPSILMLVLCVGVLAVGVFAITPTQNQITGSITINAVNPAMEITVFNATLNKDGEEVSRTKVGSTVYSRAGAEIPFGSLSFNMQNVNEAKDAIKLKVVLSVKNTSSEPLGMYFATSANATASKKTGPVELDAVSNGTPIPKMVQASFTNYTSMPEGETSEVAVTFSLLKLHTEQATITLADWNLYLNIENVKTQLLPIETDSYFYDEGQLILKAGAGTGEFTQAKMNEIKTYLTSKSVSWTDVTDLDFGTSQFTTINGGLNNVNLNSVVLNNNITTIWNVVSATINKIWFPSSVVIWNHNAGDYNNFWAWCFTGDEVEGGYENVQQTINTIYFESQNSSSFVCNNYIGGEIDSSATFAEIMVYFDIMHINPEAEKYAFVQDEDYFFGKTKAEFLELS